MLTSMLDEDTDPRKNGYAAGAVPQNVCSTLVSVCVHWVTTSADAVPPADQTPANSRPDQVDDTLAVLETVLDTYTDLGFRSPKSDVTSLSAGANPNGFLDVYLADLGSEVFGKCASDDPNKGNLGTALYQYYDVSAYCVLDNDLERSILEVTAAHEVFHALQYAYDYLEDLWFMEGTAVAMEDVVFDDANDNLRYLTGASPLTDSHKSIDYGDPADPRFAYGSWIFWRFLTEYYYVDEPSGGPDPAVIRLVWEQADAAQPAPGAPEPPDLFSMQAAESVGGDVFKDAFSFFGAYNLAPSDFYEEGTSYPSAPINLPGKTVSKAKPSLKMTAGLPHMTNHTIEINLGKGVTRSAKLKVAINGPANTAGPRATVVVDPVDPEKLNTYTAVTLNAKGDGSATVNFGKGKIYRVVVVLTNA
ncbi:MAG: MXAN_6640 family putative metalloprotease, partial [Actinomycetota bacterium]